MTRALALLVILALPGGALGQDTWSDPFAGVRRLHRRTSNQNVNVLVVDLCAAGVELRATATSERRRTPSSFGALVGAQAAINGDFFSYTDYSTNGLSMHAGDQWPGTADGTYVGPVAFGPNRADIIPHEVLAGPEPWMREIVSGHPTILRDGAVQDHSGDPLCSARHPRTIIGMSADRATLYLAVVDGRATTRIGMTCVEEATLLRDLGASIAVNMDGGGSSAMWLSGPGVVSHPSDGSERTVANHLALYARGSGEPAHCPNRAPRGWLDAATCEEVRGWAQDPDEPERAIDVHLYYGGPAGDPAAIGRSVSAGLHRDDLCAAIGSCAHGFSARPPRSLLDGVARPVFAYGIDTAGGSNPVLAGAPQMLACDPPALPLASPEGVLRHVPSPEVMAAWGFDVADVARPSEAVLAEYERGAPWPSAIELARAEGEAPVYVVDGARRRHVASPAVMDAWGFGWDAIRTAPPAELASLTEGVEWMTEPFLVADGGAIYVVDRVEPEPVIPPVDDAAATALDAGPSAEDGGARDAGEDGRYVLGPGCSIGARGASATPALLLGLGLGLARRRRS